MSIPAEAAWETDVYSRGRQLNRYPFDAVVSFVWHHRPEAKPIEETRILEVGCGTANNLWFAAREGFRVAGIDISPTAIDHARRRFADDGLDADLRVGELAALPFDDACFDLVIDRGAITCVPLPEGRRAAAEVARVLVPGGRFFFNPFSSKQTVPIDAPSVVRYGRRDLDAALGDFTVVSREHVTIEAEDGGIRAEWRVVCERPEPVA